MARSQPLALVAPGLRHALGLILLGLVLSDTRAQSPPPEMNSQPSEFRRLGPHPSPELIVQDHPRPAGVIHPPNGVTGVLAFEAQELADALPIAQSEEQSTASAASTFAPPSDSGEPFYGRYRVDYDKGFAIVPANAEESPFSLKVNNQTTFRYSGFVRDVDSWTDSAGNATPIIDNSDFLIPRGRLIFTGKAFLPEMSYLFNIDYNTAGRNQIGFRAYSLSYRFNRAVEVSVGQNKVPGSREWIYSSWVAQEGPDRTMATTFFRPSLSQGIWLKGEPIDRLFYHAMLSNGFNTLNRTPGQSNHRVCISESIWWEPWGDFGPGFSDIESHPHWVVRAGSSYTYALAQGNQSDSDAAENSSLRLSDGTVITLPGAFAPGVTLQAYDVSLAAFDLALKCRGLSLSTELYFQDLRSLRGNAPLPFRSTSASGGYVQGGYFILPGKVEIYTRTSWVTGGYGSGTEIAGGFNWFVLPGQSNLRFTFDVTDLESSPADQNRTGFVAGQSGLLFRTQINASF